MGRVCKLALCALILLGAHTASAQEASSFQGISDTVMFSVIAQRAFVNVLPSITDRNLTDDCGYPARSFGGAPAAKWNVWATPFMQSGKKEGESGFVGSDLDIVGVSAGIGRILGDNAVVGLALGWDKRKAEVNDFTDPEYPDNVVKSKSRSDAFHAALYGGVNFGSFSIDAYAGYSQAWYRNNAKSIRIANPSVMAVSKSKYDNTTLAAGVKANHVLALSNGVRFVSSLGLDYSHVRMGKDSVMSDKIAYANIFRSHFNSLQAPVRVSLNRTFESGLFSFCGGPSLWTPEIRAGYVQQIGKTRAKTSLQEIGDQLVLKSESVKIGSYGTIGAGINVNLANRFDLAVDYDFQLGSKYKMHVLTGTIGMSF